MSLALVLALAVGSVHGVATVERIPLPGCTVTLTSSAVKQVVTTDLEGRYRFDDVETGLYQLLFELEGLESVQRTVEVVEGSNGQPPEELRFEPSDPIRISCRPCQIRPPESVWDYPDCLDYDVDEFLIAR